MNDGAVCPHVEGFHIQENTSLYGYYSECVSQPELTFVRTIYYSRLKKKKMYTVVEELRGTIMSTCILIYTLCCPCSRRLKIIITGEMARFLVALFQRTCMKLSPWKTSGSPVPVPALWHA